MSRPISMRISLWKLTRSRWILATVFKKFSRSLMTITAQFYQNNSEIQLNGLKTRLRHTSEIGAALINNAYLIRCPGVNFKLNINTNSHINHTSGLSALRSFWIRKRFKPTLIRVISLLFFVVESILRPRLFIAANVRFVFTALLRQLVKTYFSAFLRVREYRYYLLTPK